MKSERPERPISVRADQILGTPQVRREEIRRVTCDGEIIFMFVNVYGNDTLGFIASSEEWFTPNSNGGPEPEFFEVRFQTSIHATVDDALADAMPSAQAEADGWAAGFADTYTDEVNGGPPQVLRIAPPMPCAVVGCDRMARIVALFPFGGEQPGLWLIQPFCRVCVARMAELYLRGDR